MQFNVQLGAPNTLTNITVPYNAAKAALADGNSKDTAASNTVIVVQDTEGPQPVFVPLSGTQSTSENKTLVMLDFGERVLGADPSKLFRMIYEPEDKGFSRVDLIYDVNAGQIFIIGQIRDVNVSTLITFEVIAGSTTDLVGNPTAGTIWTLSYSPTNAVAAAIGDAMASTFAYSSAMMMAGAAVGAVPPLAMAQTANRAQTTYLVGQIPMAGMPSSYSGMSNAFSFMTMDFP